MRIDRETIEDLVCDSSLENLLIGLVNTPSPTGDEASLARHIVKKLDEFGVASHEQVIDATQSNALGAIEGARKGKRVLLYSPIDTVTSNDADEDLPWAGPVLRDDMIACAYVDEEFIYGLGAHNPKGHAACILEAARVLARLGCNFDGEVMLGFGAGGMPTNAREGKGEDSGHGAGCDFMLEHAEKPDAAIIAKSGWAVSWEEVGFLWLDVFVQGIHTYVGSRHLLPYSNAIQNASRLIVELEQWFERRAEELATLLTKPQAVVSHIESGWKRMPAFTPALCSFRIDFRFGPDASPEAAEQAFSEKLTSLCEELDIRASYQLVKAIPATRTDPSSSVITDTISAWEQVAGRPHRPIPFASGATDANILRHRGVPTARVGLPKARLSDIDFQLGMNCVARKDLRNLTVLLVLAALKAVGVATHG